MFYWWFGPGRDIKSKKEDSDVVSIPDVNIPDVQIPDINIPDIEL